MGGVGSLDELVGGGEVVANDDVDVLLVRVQGFLRVAHVLLLSVVGSRLRNVDYPAPPLVSRELVLPPGIEPGYGLLESPGQPLAHGSVLKSTSR